MENKMQIIDGDKVKEVSPEIVAELFARMGSDEQARFFNRVSEIASVWSGGFPMQLQWITDDDGLTLSGRRVMQQIGDYSHWGLVGKCIADAMKTA